MKKCLLFLLFAPAVMSAMDTDMDFDQFDQIDTAETGYIEGLRKQYWEIMQETQGQDRIKGLEGFAALLQSAVAEKGLTQGDKLTVLGLALEVKAKLGREKQKHRAANPVQGSPPRRTFSEEEAPTPMEVDQ